MSWVSVLCRGSDTRTPCSVSFCEHAVSSLLGHMLFCPRVLWCACSSCFYRLHAFMLYLVLCGTQLVYFIVCVLSCCHGLCEQDLWVFSLAACSCPVLHMAFVLVFCVPCALMLIVLTPPILFPDYCLICPTCVLSLPSSFAPFIISLCLQSCASSSSHVSCPALSSLVLSSLVQPCPALSSLVKPGCQPVFPYGVVAGSCLLLFCFIFY